MQNEPNRYPRRDFFHECAAIPLAVSFALIVPDLARGDQSNELVALLEHIDPKARYHRVPVADAENAWPILLRAKNTIQALLFAGDGDEALWDEALTLRPFPRGKGGGQLHETLLNHPKALGLIDQATARAKLQYPEPSGWKTFDRDVENVGHLRNCFMLKTLRAKLAFHEQRYSDAARDLCELLRLGQMLIRGDGLAVQLLVGHAVRAEVCGNLRRLSLEPEVPSDVLKRALAALDEAAHQDDGAAQSLRVELCCFALPILNQIPETKDIAKLVRGFMTEFVCHDPPKKRTQAAENCEQFEQGVAALLAEHPQPFDRRATVELAGKITADAIDQLKIPFLKRKRELFETVEKELAAWPKPLRLEETFPFYFTEIAGLTEKLQVPSRAAIAIAQKELRNVSNPLGKILVLSNADTYVRNGRKITSPIHLAVSPC